MGLRVYRRKRKFDQTPEPKGAARKKRSQQKNLRFVVQLHKASRLHFDFRLEMNGVFQSWAVPKGPSLNAQDQRLAIHVEDHPLEYGSFEGVIPKGNYGAGTVMVWDQGTYLERGSEDAQSSERAMLEGLARGHMTFLLFGEKLRGEFALIRLKKDDDKTWLLVKKRDEFSTYKNYSFDETSVKSGRTMLQITEEAERAGDVWLPKAKQKRRSGEDSKKLVLGKVNRLSKSDPMPRRVRPMLPVPHTRELPTGEWGFEKNLAGLRSIAEVDERSAHLHSKSLMSFDKKFPKIVADLKNVREKMILDGEIKDEVFWVSDILYSEGKDLREVPLIQRRQILHEQISSQKFIRIKPMFESFSEVKNADEGVIAKNLKSTYQSGMQKEWLLVRKLKEKSHPENEVRLTHLEKIYWPEERISKGDLINYYRSVAKFILPHLVDRPESMHRFPNGIGQPGFFQKDMTGYKPKWLKTQKIYSESNDKTVDYVLCQDEKSLLHLINLGCIELNPWLSRVAHLDSPDYLVIDLDPDGNRFAQVVDVAFAVKEVLDAVSAPCFVKTSGSTGLHICVPTHAKYTFEETRDFAEQVCRVVQKKFPASTSVDRSPARRRKKIYLDFLQNRRGQTLAAPYCVRPRSGAPVSTPLKWSELTQDLRPEQFHLENTLQRLKKVGDLWQPILTDATNLAASLRKLHKNFV